jgi:hypothetical protein
MDDGGVAQSPEIAEAWRYGGVERFAWRGLESWQHAKGWGIGTASGHI